VLWASFGRDYYATSNRPGDSGYYRPVTVLVNALDVNVWQERTWGFHVTNLVLHALACLALVAALQALGAAASIAWLSALFFAAHPAHAESVAFISGRADVLAALFVFLAVACAESRARFAWLGVGLAAFLAFMSKESAVTLPALVVLTWWARARRAARAGGVVAARGARRWPRVEVVALGVAALAALVLRHAALGAWLPTSARNARAAGALLLPFKALLAALASLYAPVRLLAIEPDAAHLDALRLLVGALVAVTLWAAAWVADRRSRPLLGLGLVAACVTLLPVLDILPQETAISERFLYLPSAFLLVPAGVLVAAGWERRGRWRWASVAALAVLLLSLAGLSTWRAVAWRDDLRVWRRAVAEEPGRAAFWDRLGLTLTERKRYDEAERALRRAVAIEPNYFNAQLNLGVLLHSTQRYAAAAAAYRKALALQPRHVTAHLDLGIVLIDMRDSPAAMQEFETVLGLKPEHPEALRMAVLTAARLGRLEDARRYLEIARRVLPGNPDVESAAQSVERAEKMRAARGATPAPGK